MDLTDFDIFKLQYGQRCEQDLAERHFKNSGFPDQVIQDLRREGERKMQAAMNDPSDHVRQIIAKEIAPPLFLPDVTKVVRESYIPHSQTSYNTPSFNPAYWQPTSNAPKSQGDPLSQINLVPLSQLGLSMVAAGSDYKLYISNYDLVKETFNKGSFIADYKGQKVYKMGFKGNQSVSSKLIASQKAAFLSNVKTLKLVKGLGVGAGAFNVGISGMSAFEKNDGESWAKFGLDVVMFGVGFIPPWGWVVAGMYGIIDGALSSGEVNWWHSFYENYLMKVDDYVKEAFESFERIDEAHRRITGKSVLFGPKF